MPRIPSSSDGDSSPPPDSDSDAEEAGTNDSPQNDRSESRAEEDDEEYEDEDSEEEEESEEEDEDDDDDAWEPDEPKKKGAAPSSGSKGSVSTGKGKAGSAAAGKSAGVGKSGSASKQSGTSGGGGGSKSKSAPLPKPVLPDTEESKTSEALQAKAEKSRLVRSDRTAEYEYPLLHPSKELRQLTSARSVAVTKKAKAAASKPRYLLMLPGKFAPMEGGDIGTIERLDTPNPEMYLDFPRGGPDGQGGKLRLRGTILHPRSKYLTLMPKAGELVCDEAFDNIIVFSEAAWMVPKVGSGDAAPADGAGGAGADEAAAKEVPLETASLPSVSYTHLTLPTKA